MGRSFRQTCRWTALVALLVLSPGAGRTAGPLGDEAISEGVELILERQEGPEEAEWPYQVREDGKSVIPIGYRVGGTSITGTALLRARGLDEHPERLAALERAVDFVVGATAHPQMSYEAYEGGYDVRIWGYIYGLSFLLEAETAGLRGSDADATRAGITHYVRGIHDLEIPGGGWHYARRGPRLRAAEAAAFVTAPALQALFLAARGGHDVDGALIERALTVLELSRTKAGAVAYSGSARGTPSLPIESSIARMAVTETTLLIAGRGEVAAVRRAVEAFFEHWKWLEARRAQEGTHAEPYGIAPYYFFFGHHYAAQAVELLPEDERPAYRRRLQYRLAAVRSKDGTWNVRVSPRSASFGTAMAMTALLMPQTGPPVGWAPDAEAE